MKKIAMSSLVFMLLLFTACGNSGDKVTKEEAKEIAEEAYIFAYPMIEHYKSMFVFTMYI